MTADVTSGKGEEAKQKRHRKAAARCFGVFAGGDPRRSGNVKEVVREIARRKHALAGVGVVPTDFRIYRIGGRAPALPGAYTDDGSRASGRASIHRLR